MSDGMDAALGRILRPDPAPGDLREALLAEARVRDRIRRRRPLRRALPWGLAALLLLLMGSGGAWLKHRTRSTGAVLAQAALSDFMAIRALSPEEANEALVPVSREGEPCPDPGAGTCSARPGGLPRSCSGRPLGCPRGCRLRGQQVACYRLQDGRSLYVFPAPIPGAASQHGKPLAVAANYQASAWNEDGRGFVLVTPRPGS